MSSSIGRVIGIGEGYSTPQDHFLDELDWFRLLLHEQVLRLRAAGQLVENDFRGLYVADEQVDAILRNEPEQVHAGLSEQIRCKRASIDARISAASEVALPLFWLEDLLHLSPLEVRVLIACAASEVDLSFETLIAYVQNDVNRKKPTVDLMLKMFARGPSERLSGRRVFSPEGKLLGRGLIRAIELPEAQSSLARAYRTDERVTGFLLGEDEIDLRLRNFASVSREPTRFSDLLLPAHLKESLANAAAVFRNSTAILVFCGAGGTGKCSTAQAISQLSGRTLISADMAAAVASPVPLTEIFFLLRREAMLQHANLYLGNCQQLPTDKGQHVALLERELGSFNNLVILGTEVAPSEFRFQPVQPALWFQFPLPCYSDRRRLWERAVRETGMASFNLDLQELGSKFALTGGQIQSASSNAALAAKVNGANVLSQAALEAAAREQSGHGLRRLAQKIESTQGWADLILPPRAMQQLRAVSASQKYRDVVYSEWGFGNKLAMGKGLNVLFFGPSGTGKTMAASILANDLGLDIYKIDLSSVVSKYIGETEKQLSQIFREAQTSNAILLFDEADALFGKRSEVKDARDRYANIETAYLLQKMEEYEGVVILTTNFRKNLDEAFARRMHHIVEFPFPDAGNRLNIWKGLVPAEAQIENGVDFPFLARQFELAGGSIRNAMLSAAFLAAEDESAIRMDHLLLATGREMLKLGRLPSRSDFREYFDAIHAHL